MSQPLPNLPIGHRTTLPSHSTLCNYYQTGPSRFSTIWLWLFFTDFSRRWAAQVFFFANSVAATLYHSEMHSPNDLVIVNKYTSSSVPLVYNAYW